MQTCETCRHWDETSPYGDGFGECQLIQSEQYLGDADNPCAIAYVTDDGHYDNRLRTLPTFGCIAHEPRE